jgi:PHS family inorganic phosphate transporter-like MFS transporter
MALPGYWVGVLLIEGAYTGRKNTQLVGFIALSMNYAVMGYIFEDIKQMPSLFLSKFYLIFNFYFISFFFFFFFFHYLVLYGLTFFITNAGPNTTTFVLPSESFPTRIRATYHGVSAASGKAGAALGAIAMAWILDAGGMFSFNYLSSFILFCCDLVHFYFFC